MRTVGDAKTKSAPKRKPTHKQREIWAGYRRIIIILLVLVAIVAVTIPRGRFTRLLAGNTTYRLLVANSASEQETGLGNRASLPHDEGMLFPSYASGKQCYWMKNMQFSLDIIWVDSSKKITHIEPGLSPSTYPQQYCGTGQYVIELNAGQAKASGLHIGQLLEF
jgi:uncharacterized membrane protein (UPF0127 family)